MRITDLYVLLHSTSTTACGDLPDRTDCDHLFVLMSSIDKYIYSLVEMTRKRTRESLVQALCEPCVHCEGRGYMLSGESVAYNILREIKNDMQRLSGQKIAITVSPRVAEKLLSGENAPLDTLSEELGREIEVRARAGLHEEQFEVESLEPGPAAEFAPAWLRDPAEIAAEEKAERERRNESKSGGNGRRRSRGRGRGRGQAANAENAENAEKGAETSQTVDTENTAAPEATGAEAPASDAPSSATLVLDPISPPGEEVPGPVASTEETLAAQAAPKLDELQPEAPSDNKETAEPTIKETAPPVS